MRKLFFVSILFAACESFDAPPEGSIEGGPVLTSGAPLVVRFQKPVNPDTLRMSVVPYDVDREGNLADEDTDDATELHPYYKHDPFEGEVGGFFSLTDDDTVAHLDLNARLPVGKKLAVLIEPGLANRKRVKTTVRDRLLFSYDFKCSGKPTQIFQSGPYMFLLDVETPIGIQIQLFAQLRVEANGKFVGQLSNADRNRDGSRCPGGCPPTDACRLVPMPECVEPSRKAISVDEFSDYVPNVSPPTGYTLTIEGCAEDQDNGSVAIGIAPVDLTVVQPPVTARGLVVIASFEKDANGVLRGNGSGTAGEILFGIKAFGEAKGTFHGRSIPADQLPPGVPGPP